MQETSSRFVSFSTILPPDPPKIFKPLLETLGRIVGGSPNVFVGHDEIVSETLREAGISEFVVDSGSEIGWNRDRVRSTVMDAFRNGTDAQSTFPLFKMGTAPDSWGLTAAGASAVDPERLKGKNLTSAFLDARIVSTGGINGKFMKGLRAAVGSKLQLSAAIGIVDDHVQTCLMRLVQRDSLRERILSGMRIPDGQIASYAVRSAFNDCRDSGTEPVARAMCGARTERERDRDVNVYAPVTTRLAWRRAEVGADEFDDFDVVDTTPGSLDVLSFNEIMDGLESIAHANHPDAALEIVEIFRTRAEGLPLPRVSPVVAAKIKDCVKKAAHGGLLKGLDGADMVAVFRC